MGCHQEQEEMKPECAGPTIIERICALQYEEIEGKLERRRFKWANILAVFFSHAFALYGILFLTPKVKPKTLIFNVAYGFLGGLGVTAGVHRLWCHRSYKAKLPLRIVLAIFFSISGQNSIHQWVLDHRTHHKYTETNADPHNAARGFFFSHVGWLLQEKSHVVKSKGKTIDMSDIKADPVVAIHERLFLPLKVFFAFLLPIAIPKFGWNETWYHSAATALVRYIILLHCTWSVNSIAHIWGKRPYDRRMGPAENRLVAYIALGEGWHNYHHVFPWDYRAAEFGIEPNFSTTFIDSCARIGQAYDLRAPSKQLIDKISQKYGDGCRAVGQDNEAMTTLEPEHEELEPELISY